MPDPKLPRDAADLTGNAASVAADRPARIDGAAVVQRGAGRVLSQLTACGGIVVPYGPTPADEAPGGVAEPHERDQTTTRRKD